MLTETASPGVLTLRASSHADRAEIGRRSIRALQLGHRVVALMDTGGCACLVFEARRAGGGFFARNARGSADASTAEAAVVAGLAGWAFAWEQDA